MSSDYTPFRLRLSEGQLQKIAKAQRESASRSIERSFQNMDSFEPVYFFCASRIASTT